ncbi:uncharacterized protein [Dendrobates tinctorius]|uniref:uncharacterized protein isoform X2 n=1 Tax=Dendrobates tinctorius TaxID=92724 RepID=UPI003CC930C1
MRLLIREEVQASTAGLTRRQSPSPGPSRKRPRWEADPVSEASPSEDSDFRDSDQEEEGEIPGDRQDQSRKYLFRLEDMDELVQAVRNTMQIEEVPKPQSRQDLMFGGLMARKQVVFPVSEHIKTMVQEEWKEAERRLILSRDFKNRLPFDPEETRAWEEVPKIDVPVAKVTKKTAIPFEDSSGLRDPMDRKADVLLKRTWETSAALIRANIAATSVARSMFLWMGQLEEHLTNKTPRSEILASLPVMKSATAFLSDTSAESVRLQPETAPSLMRPGEQSGLNPGRGITLLKQSYAPSPSRA